MLIVFLFFFNDTATTEIYTLSLHDALPISLQRARPGTYRVVFTTVHGTEEEQLRGLEAGALDYLVRSEEHTSELQSPCNLVCRLLLEKKKIKILMHRLILTQADILSLKFVD